MHSKLLLLRPLVRAIDVVFASFVITPLVVIYWVSTWSLCDIYITPEEPETSALISFAIGLVGQFVLTFYQSTIAKLLNFKKCRLLNFIVSKLYALFAAVTCINLWRGLWVFADSVSSDDVTHMARNVIQNLAILLLTRTTKNSIANPFVVMTDQSNSDYHVSTYFNTTKADGRFKFLLDCIFTNFVFLLVVLVWRDLWAAFDLYFYPNDPMMSNCGSLLIGAVLSLICFASESTVNRLFEKNKTCRIIVHDAFTLVCLLATINVWRALWNIGFIYTENNTKLLFVLNGVSWKLLTVVNCVSSLSGRGVFKDRCAVAGLELPVNYFQTMLDEAETKKIMEKKTRSEVSIITKL